MNRKVLSKESRPAMPMRQEFEAQGFAMPNAGLPKSRSPKPPTGTFKALDSCLSNHNTALPPFAMESFARAFAWKRLDHFGFPADVKTRIQKENSSYPEVGP